MAVMRTDPNFAYDALNRLSQTIDPLGGLATVVYDAAGNTIASADPLNHRTSYGYDALNRRVTLKDPLGFTTTTRDRVRAVDAMGKNPP